MKSLTEFLIESLLNEGGHVFTGGTDKIAREDIPITLEKWLEIIQKAFPKVAQWWKNPKTLGSVGKKDFSGDIDIAIDERSLSTPEDWGINPQHLSELYAKNIKRARTAKPNDVMKKSVLMAIAEIIREKCEELAVDSKGAGNGVIFTQFIQYDASTKQPNGKTVQIDVNFGDVDWLSFAYYSDSYAGNVKGLHRTQLMLHLFVIKGYTFYHNRGVKDSKTGEMVVHTPEEAIELLNKLYGFNITQPILSNYFKLQEYLHDNLDEKTLDELYDVYLKTLDSTRCDIPEDLQPYWVENQGRLGLKGKFLPNDSALVPLKK